MSKIIKGIFVIMALISTVQSATAQSPNPIVQRLDNQEIAECRTPAAVAYNFVIAMLNKNQEKMIQLSEGEFNTVIRNRFDDLMNSLNGDRKLDIFQWVPMKPGYEVAVLYVQSEDYASNIPAGTLKKVYIDCIPSSEIGNTGFQEVSRDMRTNVKVLVNNKKGRWLVEGFK